MILIIIGLIRHIRVIMHVSHCAGNKNEVIYLHTHICRLRVNLQVGL